MAEGVDGHDAEGLQDWDAIARALTVAEAEERFLQFQEQRGQNYAAILLRWNNAWAEFVPFLGFDRDIRRIVCITDAIESVNARIRRPSTPGGTSRTSRQH